MGRRFNGQVGVVGTVYLIHLDQPYQHARHYLGWTEGTDISRRIGEHLSARGSPLLAAATAAGISWQVVRTWPGKTREFERRLHRQRSDPKLCPQCNPNAAKRGSLP